MSFLANLAQVYTQAQAQKAQQQQALQAALQQQQQQMQAYQQQATFDQGLKEQSATADAARNLDLYTKQSAIDAQNRQDLAGVEHTNRMAEIQAKPSPEKDTFDHVFGNMSLRFGSLRDAAKAAVQLFQSQGDHRYDGLDLGTFPEEPPWDAFQRYQTPKDVADTNAEAAGQRTAATIAGQNTRTGQVIAGQNQRFAQGQQGQTERAQAANASREGIASANQNAATRRTLLVQAREDARQQQAIQAAGQRAGQKAHPFTSPAAFKSYMTIPMENFLDDPKDQIAFMRAKQEIAHPFIDPVTFQVDQKRLDQARADFQKLYTQAAQARTDERASFGLGGQGQYTVEPLPPGVSVRSLPNVRPGPIDLSPGPPLSLSQQRALAPFLIDPGGLAYRHARPPATSPVKKKPGFQLQLGGTRSYGNRG